MYCPKCGTQNDDNNFKCTKCGAVIQNIPVTPVVKKKSSLTIVLVVAGIAFGLIAMLAAIGIPAYIDFQTKVKESMTKGALRNACNSAAVFFLDNPDKVLTIDDLKGKGADEYPEVGLSIMDGTKDNLMIGARHSKGGKGYAADRDCNIKEMQP